MGYTGTYVFGNTVIILKVRISVKRKMNKPIKQTTEYVNNEKFYLEMVRYKAAVEEARKKDLPKPRPSEYIGECIMLIARKLSNHKNFIGYSNNYKEEMISDGIENCLLYIDNFDPDKTNKPFAYFTQVIYFAFIRRLQREKKQAYIKAKQLQIFSHDSDEVTIDKFMKNDAMNDLIRSFEKSDEKKKKPSSRKKSALDFEENE